MEEEHIRREEYDRQQAENQRRLELEQQAVQKQLELDAERLRLSSQQTQEDAAELQRQEAIQ